MHFPAVVRIHMTTSDPSIGHSAMFSVQSGLGWPTPGTECHAGWILYDFTTAITRRQWQLTSIYWPARRACFRHTHARCHGGVKILSFLISSELGCKGLRRPSSRTTALKTLNLPVTLSGYNKHRPFRLAFYCLLLGKEKKKRGKKKKGIAAGLALQSQCDYEGLGSKSFFFCV